MNSDRLSQASRYSIKADIQKKQAELRLEVLQTGNLVEPRTQAANIKFPADTVEQEREFREDVLEAQILSWKKILPEIIRLFSKVPPDGTITQQYVAVLEANITLHNGLSIPLLSEFLYYDGNDNITKQDCELTGFKRLCKKIKSYFKRQNILVCLDKLYACESVLKTINTNNWNYIIVLPSNKLTIIDGQLNKKKGNMTPLADQLFYNGRKQFWYWANNIEWRNFNNLNAVACLESWVEVDKETGKIKNLYSEHKWITNIRVRVSLKNIHQLCNIGARKRWLIEDSNNTEKNRGYHYKHAYSYTWNGMICFHYLMRLAHAINVLSEFTKRLKSYIKKYGCSYILSLIKETLWNPWVTQDWLKSQMKKPSVFAIESS